jgi:hypothetical protein
VFVHRPVAIVLGFALASASVAPTLHIHAYVDHDHPEHHHGLAAHEHHSTATTARVDVAHDKVHVETCEPGRHAVSFVFVYSASPQYSPILAEVVSPATLSLDVPRFHRVKHTDIRVHGPPAGTQSPPRAPPDDPRLITLTST